jgi:hypothetical protein
MSVRQYEDRAVEVAGAASARSDRNIREARLDEGRRGRRLRDRTIGPDIREARLEEGGRGRRRLDRTT